MYALISDYWYALINGIIIPRYVHVLFIESAASTASLSDEDAVYLIENVGGLHFCKRVRSPYSLRGPSTYM